MTSGTVPSPDFAAWTPPPLRDLTFGTNCTLTKDFLRSWFDLSPYEDIDDFLGSDRNTTFWIPLTLPSEAVERYFRDALPRDIQQVAAYGEILEWEHYLRAEFAQAREAWLDLMVDPNSDYGDDNEPPLDMPYFQFAIETPSRLCHEDVCELNFDDGRLGDVNGPGVFIFYLVQLSVGAVYSLITLFEALRWFRYRNKHNHAAAGHTLCSLGFYHPTGKRSIIRALYNSVKASYGGFSDSAAVFALVLPAAIITHNFASSTPMVWTKDLLLQYWVLLYSNVVCLWLVRLGACIRRLENTRRQVDPSRRSRKPTILSESLMYLSFAVSICSLAAMLALFHLGDIQRPYKFERFWDDVCDFRYSLPTRNLVIAASVLAGYCVVRGVILAVIASCLARRQTKGLGTPARLTDKRQIRLFHLKRLRVLTDIHHNNPTYRTFADVLGIMDVLLLGLGSGAALYLYGLYRWELFAISDVHGFRDGWTLGQVLAISTLLPLLIEFLHQLAQEWRAGRPSK